MTQRRFELEDYFFTSESVSEGHPDKVCDQISDAILDAYLTQDPYARVAAETLVCPGRVIIAGEVRGPDIPKSTIEDIARQQIRHIGYAQEGFHWENVAVEVLLHQQSADIAQGVDAEEHTLEGAGDQGIMFGYASDETEALMPAPIYYSHLILQRLFAAIHAGEVTGLGPDAKSQVSLVYEHDTPARAKSVVVSIQHSEDLTQDQVREKIRPFVEETLPKGWMCEEDEFYVNPTGRFVIGGPVGDVGLTGRKIIVDTYGGAAPHGGGAFSGKDPSKVDRSAAYVSRYLAKNVVASGLAQGCTIQLAYAIGVAKPLSLYVNTHGTGEVPDETLATRLQELVDLSPWGLRDHLQLHKPIYLPSAAYGHFGREPTAEGHFSWEKCDLIDALKEGL